MIRIKPSIHLYHNAGDDKLIKEICAGMEEEGVPFEITKYTDSDVDMLCYEASKNSVLGVGIGVINYLVAIQMSPLPKGKNLFRIDHPTLIQGRLLGMNAARAVKRMPFKPI